MFYRILIIFERIIYLIDCFCYVLLQKHKTLNFLKEPFNSDFIYKKKDINNSLKHIDASDHQYLKDIFDCTGSFLSVKKNLDRLKINKINIKEIEDLNNIYNKISKS